MRDSGFWKGGREQAANGRLVHASDAYGGEVVLDQSQFFQRPLQEPAIHGIPRRARTEGIAQLVCCGPSALVREAASVGSVSPSAIARSMRRALVPSRSDTKLDNLMGASSSR